MAKLLDPTLMQGYGKALTIFGETRPCGLQVDPKTLKPWTDLAKNGFGPAGNAPIQITKPEAVIDGYDLTASNILIKANNVVIRNCLLGTTGYWKIEMAQGADNLTVELNNFFGFRSPDPSGNLQDMTVNAGRGGRLTYRQNAHWDLPSDGPNICNGLCEFNAYFGAGWQRLAHADAFSVQGPTTGPVIIRRNYIDYISRANSRRQDNDAFIPFAMPRNAPQGTNSGIKISAHFGNIANVLVEENVILGGTFNMYIGPDKGTVSGVTVRNNLMGLSEYNAPDDENGFLFRKTENIHGGYVWTNNTAFTKAPDGVVAIGSAGSQPTPVPPPVVTPPPVVKPPVVTPTGKVLTDAELQALRAAVDTFKTVLG